MKTPLRVLIAEDDPADAELILRELRRGDYEPQWERVDTEAAFLARLNPGLEIILSDYSMPQFTGLRALELLNESGLDLPFILISGTIGEDTAVAAMKQGATDYILKDRITRLGQAVGNALEQTRLRRQGREDERALRENAVFIADVLNSLTAEVVVVNESGEITASNEAWKRFARENGGTTYLGQNYLAVCTRSGQRFPQSEAVAARDGIGAVLDGLVAEFIMEYPCHAPTVQRWFQMRVSPLSGDQRGAVVAHELITERKQAEQALLLFRKLVDQSNDAFEVIDPASGRFLDVNEKGCEQLGYTRAEYLALRVVDIAPQLDESRWHLSAEHIRTAGASSGEAIHRRKDGTTFPIEYSSKWVRLDRDYIVTVVRDITERKLAEQRVHEQEEADRANRAKSEFLSRMSHELRTPLHAILGFAQLLEMDDLRVEEKESVAQIVRAGKHLLGLINEVLDIARVESGKLALTPEPVSVRPTLEEALALVKPLAAARQIRLEPLAGDADCEVLSSAQRFKQILLNLLSNAVKFNRAGGSVAVSCEKIQDYLRIKVADTGRGISIENQARLFVPFERLDEVDAVIEGSGLGLSLSKHLVEAMGGRIGVESTLGEGTTFWVELPLIQPTSAATALHLDTPVRSVAEAPRCTAPRTVLYIEDNLSNLRLIERILARRPEVTLISALKGGIGLEMARHHLPDLVLLDLHLPDMQGDEVLLQLRADPRTASLPIVMLSADATAVQIERLLAAGANDYLTKPIDVRRFLAVIDATVPLPARPPS